MFYDGWYEQLYLQFHKAYHKNWGHDIYFPIERKRLRGVFSPYQSN